MKIVLMCNTDKMNKLDKNVEIIKEYSDCQIKNNTSITKPTLIIGDEIDWDKVNYLYIPEWNRYYYIIDSVSLHNGLWEIICKVDVLMSFSNDIKHQKAIIARQENDYNLELNDNKLVTIQSTGTQYLRFPNSFNNYQIVIPILGN